MDDHDVGGVGGVTWTTFAAGEETEGASPCSRTQSGRELSPGRARWRAVASRLVALAASSTSSYQAVGAALGVSLSQVGRWADPEHAAAITLGDLLAGRRDFARAVLVAALGVLEETAPVTALGPERRVLRLQHQLGVLTGEVLSAIADGVVTDEERRSMARALRPLSNEIEALERELGRDSVTPTHA